MKCIIQSPIRSLLPKLCLAVAFTLGFSTGGAAKSLEDYPEACRKPIDVAAIEIPYDQIDLSASEWAPGTAALPQAVRSYIEDNSNHLFLNLASWPEYEPWLETQCHFSVSDFVGPIYRLPLNKRFKLYLFRAQGRYNYANIHLIFYDKQNQTISGRVHEIYAKWNMMDYADEVRGDWIGFEDLNGDGKQELRIVETFHNGNVYNALGHHYFEFDGIQLSRVLVLEYYTVNLFPDRHVTRQIVERSPTQLKLLEKWVEEDKSIANSFTLSLYRGGQGEPFQAKLADLKDYDGALTFCGDEPNQFLRLGCKFKY